MHNVLRHSFLILPISVQSFHWLVHPFLLGSYYKVRHQCLHYSIYHDNRLALLCPNRLEAFVWWQTTFVIILHMDCSTQCRHTTLKQNWANKNVWYYFNSSECMQRCCLSSACLLMHLSKEVSRGQPDFPLHQITTEWDFWVKGETSSGLKNIHLLM